MQMFPNLSFWSYPMLCYGNILEQGYLRRKDKKKTTPAVWKKISEEIKLFTVFCLINSDTF